MSPGGALALPTHSAPLQQLSRDLGAFMVLGGLRGLASPLFLLCYPKLRPAPLSCVPAPLCAHAEAVDRCYALSPVSHKTQLMAYQLGPLVSSRLETNMENLACLSLTSAQFYLRGSVGYMVLLSN